MIAASGLPVLITGPSGCGKEHVAQEIARLALPSSQHRRIETVNCAALTENIALSTLFGYAPGAFTGALAGGSAGILRRISGQSRHGRGPMQETELPGILILDELAELPPIVQAQLLRMMQGQTIHALGDAGTGYQAIVRVIACTNNEAKLMKPFRDDLLGRLDGWHLTVGHPHERRETFVAAARNKIGNFVVTLEPGKPPVKISGLADDVIRTVESKLVPASEGGLRFGFRELEGWVGRACSMALFRAGNDAQLTGAHLLEAWGKRMI